MYGTVQRLQIEQVVTSKIFEIDPVKRSIKIKKLHVPIGVIALRYNMELLELNILVNNPRVNMISIQYG